MNQQTETTEQLLRRLAGAVPAATRKRRAPRYLTDDARR